MNKSTSKCNCANGHNCKDEIDKAKKFVNNIIPKRDIYTVAHFDLKGSTKKMIHEPYDTITSMLLHNEMCRKIIEQNNGKIIKELGDAVMVTFKNSGMACECAIKVIRNLQRYGQGLCTKVTIASGTVWSIKTHGVSDVYGVPVNLCNRMSKHAIQDCILFEEDSYFAIKDWLVDDKKIQYRKIRKKGKDLELLDFGRLPMRKIIIN